MLHHYIRLLVLILVMLIPSAEVSAKASFSLLGCNYATVNLTYESVDTHNQPITLSAVLYYPTSSGTSVNNIKSCNYIFLNNHATITDNASSPFGGESAMGQLYWMTTDNALVVNPDYLGFGGTRDKIHPYMCQTLTARNVIDCLKAAIADAQQRGKLAANYYTINCGYSQGGGVTMAVARYLETEADEATQRLINLRSSICGAGCYGQTLILDEYEKRSSIEYPIFLPYALQGMKETYGESCMRDIDLDDCFTPKFRESGILEALNAKGTDVDALNARLKNYFGGSCSFYDIIASDYRDHNSALYRAVRKALKQNDLYEGWVPQHPITFYHYTSDEVVPYLNTTAALDAFQSAGCRVPLVLKKAEEMTDYGSWSIAKVKYPNLQQNHRDYGTCFYLLVFDGQLTPDAATDGFISTQAVTGPDRYDHDCHVAADQWTLLNFPAAVDGYYFGVDAPRYKVSGKTEVEGRYVLSLAPMADDEDFLAGADYLVAPTGDVDRITSITAGLATPVITTDAPLVSSSIAVSATTNAVGDKRYATLFSPFDVSVPADVEAFTVTLDGSIIRLTPIADGVIPAETGVVLRTTTEGELIFPYDATTTAAPLNSGLEGVLVDTEVEAGTVMTLGLNAQSVLGFYRYQGTQLAAGKAYCPITSNSNGACPIRFDGEVAGISIPMSSPAVSVPTYDLSGRRIAPSSSSPFRIVEGVKRVGK